MTLLTVSVSVFLLLALGYRFHGRRLAALLELDDRRLTPAVERNDGADYVPAPASLLLGQHFSAISAAGPIVGPVLAGLLFGWLPALLWIVLGSVFIGGAHDFASLVASVRHGGESIGTVVRRHMSPAAHRLFLCFVWLALVYVIIAFTDITAQAFRAVADGQAYGPGVAASSFLYLGLGLAMGMCLRRFEPPLWKATLVFVPLVMLAIWLGPRLPAQALGALGAVPVKAWDSALLAYCFAASVLPVWLLLQPRGYLGGCFLYGTLLACVGGIVFGDLPVRFPAVRLEGLSSAVKPVSLFPALFITVACGACSGFHAIVSSGTTSKQLARESDSLPIGYGSMLLEAVVALFALCTLMMLAPEDPLTRSDPNTVYASGVARFLSFAGVDHGTALGFALLAFSTFVYDTLDVCTRLGRYVLQELTGWKGRGALFGATALTLALPALFLLLTDPSKKAYMVVWPIFGASNQLLASLTLLAVSVWLIRTGRRAWLTAVPMAFMLLMTLWSLVLQGLPGWRSLLSGAGLDAGGWLVTSSATVLLALAGALVAEAWRALSARRTPGPAGSARAESA